jgi:hypothetical protein
MTAPTPNSPPEVLVTPQVCFQPAVMSPKRALLALPV